MDMLSWKDFLSQVKALGADGLTEDRLFDLALRLDVDSALLAPYIQFNDEGYARNVLYRDHTFEAICLCWQPGQGTSIHNHGRSYGVIHVFEGHLAVTAFRRIDDGTVQGHAEVQPVAQVYAAEGTTLLDRVGSIHRLGNPGTARRRSVSLHFYAGPLDTMELFDPLDNRVTTQPMTGEPLLWLEPGADAMAAMI